MSKSPSLRRIQADVRELALDPSDRYYAAPLEDDMFEWHFTIRGADGTDFEGGVYHGRILLPPEYPFKPPHIVFLTPSGRFETNTKVCLSFSAFHPELWQPAWGIRLILEALISFLPTPADGAIGALDWSSGERKRLAQTSLNYSCRSCGNCVALIPQTVLPNNKNNLLFAKEILELQRLQSLAEGTKDDKHNKDGEKQPQPEKEPSTGTVVVEKSSEHSSSPPVAIDEKEDTPIRSNTEPASSAQVNTTITAATATSSATKQNDGDETHNEVARDLIPEPAQAIDDQVQNAIIIIAAEQTENNDNTDNNSSWMYDPLINVMMVLLAVICYMLLQKYQELMQELRELRMHDPEHHSSSY